MDSVRIADGFVSRIIKFFFRSTLLLGVAFVFVLSILIVLFTTGGIAPYILPINGSLLVYFLAWKLARRWKRLRKKRSVPEKIESDNKFSGEYLKNLTGLPAIFTYETIEIATGGFSKEIGKGGFGTVYEGILEDDTLVAVKCLVNESRQGQAEFCAEIGTTSSINHSNLVRLHGICVEGQHRILVYEFMANGSLDRWLFDSDKWLDWKTRYSIALDTARGLAYLHEESRLCILHLDVKPQNILVDEYFKAKVSDFGMARCLKRDIESHLVTGVRGTPGYMAPEWLLGAGITSKSDVFSYGMVLLEIISGRRNVDNTRDSDNWYFPSIAINKARQDKMEEIIETGLEMKRPEDLEEAYRLIKTALWCVQSNSGLRPSMGTVVRILEGDLEILDPPSEWTLPFAPSVVYLKPSSDITLSVAEDTERSSLSFST
uniref:non-specific serine/threonine protein kinase n=1 Tax=Picea sitchensis TaxID=3332 RepID=A9NM60_PICSI|nr:unknown [Picea sitchensis]